MAVKTFYFGGREVLSRSSQRCYRVRRTKHTRRLIKNPEIFLKFRLMRSTTDFFTEACCRRSFLRILATHEVMIVADSLPSKVRTDTAFWRFLSWKSLTERDFPWGMALVVATDAHWWSSTTTKISFPWKA